MIPSPHPSFFPSSRPASRQWNRAAETLKSHSYDLVYSFEVASPAFFTTIIAFWMPPSFCNSLDLVHYGS
jgi:hypothetical protein